MAFQHTAQGGGTVQRTYDKPALNLNEQLRLLETRGLYVEDRAAALTHLARIGYYRLSGYWHPWKQPDDRFKSGASFERAMFLYEFDRKLRLVVLDGIERVEILCRAAITYTLAHSYGAFAHTDPSNFNDLPSHQIWLTKLHQEVDRANERFLQHYRATYSGFPQVPIWMALEVIPFGSLSWLFKLMLKHDQAAAVQQWGVSPEVARTWIHTLSHVRNICAHHGRLWNRELSIKPMLPRHRREWNQLNGGRVYAILCILRDLTMASVGAESWADNVRDLLSEMEPHPGWRGAMGIPPNWRSSLFWSGPIQVNPAVNPAAAGTPPLAGNRPAGSAAG